MRTHKFEVLGLALLLLAGCGKGPGGGAAAFAKKKAADQPLAQQRGLQNYDAGNTRRLVIVKAPLAAVCDALMKGNPTKVVVTDPAHQPLDVKARSYLLLQFKGHDWTVVLNTSKDAVDPERLARTTAAYLKTKAVMYGYSDFSGATRYRLYDGPREVEAIDSMDEDDAKLILEQAGPDMDADKRKILEEVKANGGIRFHSTVRKLQTDEKGDGDVFVDRALREEDALVPDLAGIELKPGTALSMGDFPFAEADLEAIAFVSGDAAPITPEAAASMPAGQ